MAPTSKKTKQQKRVPTDAAAIRESQQNATRPESRQEEEEQQASKIADELANEVDSSDEEFVADDGNDFDASKETIALEPSDELKQKVSKAVNDNKKKLTKKNGGKSAPTTEQDESAVVYIGRIPHGFYEDQMRGYFSQFGDINHLRLSRNRKTGKSKNYAFIEFKHKGVAEVVVETMNNYLMMGRILKVRLVPKDSVHPEMWKGADRKFQVIPHGLILAKKHNQDKTEEQLDKTRQRLLAKEQKFREKLKEAGIDYEFSGYEGRKLAEEPKQQQESPKKPVAKKRKQPTAKNAPSEDKPKKIAVSVPAKKPRTRITKKAKA